jgi:hypothetical protein
MTIKIDHAKAIAAAIVDALPEGLDAQSHLMARHLAYVVLMQQRDRLGDTNAQFLKAAGLKVNRRTEDKLRGIFALLEEHGLVHRSPRPAKDVAGTPMWTNFADPRRGHRECPPADGKGAHPVHGSRHIPLGKGGTESAPALSNPRSKPKRGVGDHSARRDYASVDDTSAMLDAYSDGTELDPEDNVAMVTSLRASLSSARSVETRQRDSA